MGEILFELEQVLRSKQERLSSGEANVLLTCKSRALREFTGGVLVGSGVTWLATWRLKKFLRLHLSGGAAVVLGLWRFSSSLESCLDHILAINGSRLQKELANIIVNKYRDDPWKMQLISKHFYSEKVYDDSAADQAKLRWRYRNYFSDSVAHGQTRESDPHGDFHSASQNKPETESHNEARSNIHNEPGRQKNDVGSKHVPVNPTVDVMADPLDCVFGHMATVEEISHPSASSKPNGVHTRSHKRSHRRRRMHHHDNSLNSQHA